MKLPSGGFGHKKATGGPLLPGVPCRRHAAMLPLRFSRWPSFPLATGRAPRARGSLPSNRFFRPCSDLCDIPSPPPSPPLAPRRRTPPHPHTGLRTARGACPSDVVRFAGSLPALPLSPMERFLRHVTLPVALHVPPHSALVLARPASGASTCPTAPTRTPSRPPENARQFARLRLPQLRHHRPSAHRLLADVDAVPLAQLGTSHFAAT